MQNTTHNNNNEEHTMLENDEVVVVSDAAKLRMPMMRVLCKSTEHEDLRVKIVEATIVSGVLHEHHPQVDSPANPWAKFHSNLREPEI